MAEVVDELILNFYLILMSPHSPAPSSTFQYFGCLDLPTRFAAVDVEA